MNIKYLTEEERKIAEKERNKKYYQKHKEKMVERNKKYYQEHKAQQAEYQKQYRKTPIGRALNLLGMYNLSDKLYKRGKGDLTAKWIVEHIFSQPCAYCGKKGWDVIGCNRLDNSKPHTVDNVEPCCEDCNKKLPR